jgi:hypothetical protein
MQAAVPPTMVIVSRVQIAKSRAGIAVSTQVQIHNVRDQKLTLSARVLEQGQPQQIAFTRQQVHLRYPVLPETARS